MPYIEAILRRRELLGLAPAGVVLLLADAYLILVTSSACLWRFRERYVRTHLGLIAMGLVSLAIVVLSATLLGSLGHLSNPGLVASHVLLAALALSVHRLEAPSVSWPALLLRPIRDMRRFVTRLASLTMGVIHWRRPAEGAVVVGVVGIFAFFALLATWTIPLGFDSQTYRFPRIAIWLQEGSILHVPSDDWRLNYVGQTADLLMLWIVSFFSSGFPLASWVQLSAGALACLAVYEIARFVGCRRFWRLGAVATLLGLPSVATQFFTSQTDLFAASTASAGLLMGLVAIRRRDPGAWVLSAVGLGLAVGTKVTVLYFAPALALILAAGALVERSTWRSTMRAIVLVAVGSLLLGGFNFAQNLRSFGNPVAPLEAIRLVHPAGRATLGDVSLRLQRFVWQLLEPASNSFVPELVRAPLFDSLTTQITERAHGISDWQRDLRLLDGRLDEDHSSFGLLAGLFVMLGGGLATREALRRRGGRPALVVAMFVGIGASVVVFCSISIMTSHHFRYFAVLAPIGSVVAMSGLSRVRSAVVRRLGAAFVVVQLLSAGLVGYRSEYHGWHALVNPASTPFHSRWVDGRTLVDRLGRSPKVVALAFPFDSWLAPYLRTEVGHRIRIARREDLERAISIGRFLSESGTDVILTHPAYLRAISLDGAYPLPAPWIFRAQQLALRPLAPGEPPRPAIVEAENLTWDGWTLSQSTLRVAGWRGGPMELRLLNPTPIERRLSVRSRGSTFDRTIEKRSEIRLAVEVSSRDSVTLRTRPPFEPARIRTDPVDRRSLGILIAPSRSQALSGVHADGWTGTRAEVALENWISGVCEVELSNPSPIERTIRLGTRLSDRSFRMAAGASSKVSLEVLPGDRLELSVDPPFVPAEHDARSTDRRQLGVLLAGDLLVPAREGVYR